MADYLELSKQLINEYCMEEFGNPADFSNPERVELAYTTVYNFAGEEQEVQVYVDMVAPRVVLELNGDIWEVVNLRSMEGLYDFCVANLDFSYLVFQYFGVEDCTKEVAQWN